MEYGKVIIRLKSTLIHVLSFTILPIGLLWLTSFIPVIGKLTQVAFLFGSPFMWFMAESGKFHYSGLAIFAPYSISGLLIGAIWPVEFSAKHHAIRSIAFRLSFVIIAFLSLGFLLGLYAFSHDS